MTSTSHFRTIAFLMVMILFAGVEAFAKGEFQWEDHLTKTIENEKLECTPEEFSSCQGSDNTKMWTEFMKGIAYIESSWDPKKDNPDDANGKPSRGLFQMTGGDVAMGKNCFGTTNGQSTEPYNPEKNIECAVRKMKELVCGKGGSMGGFSYNGLTSGKGKSIYAEDSVGKYWGPFKKKSKAHGKAERIVADIQQNCGSQPFDPSILNGVTSGGAKTASSSASQ